MPRWSMWVVRLCPGVEGKAESFAVCESKREAEDLVAQYKELGQYSHYWEL